MARHARSSRRLPFLLLGGAALALASGCASDGGAPMAMSQIQEGRALAQSECARCHAIRELGSSPREDAPPLREVLNRYNPSRLEQAFSEGMIVGHVDMPLFMLSDEQTAALLAYLQDIKE